MQNDIVKPSKDAPVKPVALAQEPTSIAVAPVDQPVEPSQVIAQNPADRAESGSAEVEHSDEAPAKTPQPPAAPKVHKSSGLTPVILITVIVFIALAGLAVYTQMR